MRTISCDTVCITEDKTTLFLFSLVLFEMSSSHQVVTNYSEDVSSPALSSGSSPHNCWLWCRLRRFPAVRSQSPSWRSLQPRSVRSHSGHRGFHCHLGRSPSRLQGLQRKTCCLSGLGCCSFSSCTNESIHCRPPAPPQGVARISAYLSKSAGC